MSQTTAQSRVTSAIAQAMAEFNEIAAEYGADFAFRIEEGSTVVSVEFYDGEETTTLRTDLSQLQVTEVD